MKIDVREYLKKCSCQTSSRDKLRYDCTYELADEKRSRFGLYPNSATITRRTIDPECNPETDISSFFFEEET